MTQAAWVGRFIPTKSFSAKVNGRQNKYLEGQAYHVRPGPVYDDLRKNVLKWKERGLVIVLQGVTPQATGEASVGVK